MGCPARCGGSPVTSIVTTIRDLFTERPVGGDGWIAVSWCVGLLLAAYLLAMRTYHTKVAE